jgi:hypothetical protein
MDVELSTWMDWVWSSMCLELLCTSTQSNNLKWVSRAGINSPRHSKSRWLTTTKKSKCRMNQCYPVQGIGSSGAPPTSLICWGSLTELLRRYDPTHRLIIWCWRSPHQNLTMRIFETFGWTAAPPSVHLVLKLKSGASLSWFKWSIR